METIGVFYKKHKEILSYLFFGGWTFLVSVLSYALFVTYCHLHELFANVVSWIIAVLFAFLTNRIWVFQASTNGIKEYLKQMVTFFVGRISTLLIEEAILCVFITWLAYPSVAVKIVAQVVVIVLNYVISKLWVFK